MESRQCANEAEGGDYAYQMDQEIMDVDDGDVGDASDEEDWVDEEERELYNSYEEATGRRCVAKFFSS